MKLIKQNDSSGGLIFKQNQNGKAMRQNYNFGHGFRQPGNIYFDIPSLVGATFLDFTFLHFHKLGDGQVEDYRNGGIVFDIGGERINSFYAGYEWNQDQIRMGRYLNSAHFNFPATNLGINRTFTYWKKQGDNFSQGDTVVNGSFTTSDYPAIENVSNVYVGISYVRDGTHISKFLRSDEMLFSRAIPIEELSYIYNNGQGNEPLNVKDLIFFLKHEKAEIINFGGSIGDAVGVMDFSGKNNHARIKGLPAGTLQEQVDYANANLFEVW